MGQRASYDPTDYTPRVVTDETALDLLRRDTSRKFHDLMDAAMLVSAYKYGPVSEGYPERVDAMKSLHKRLAEYEATGNVEWLIDVANFAMIEFMHPRHHAAHYKATDAVASPGRVPTNEIYEGKANQYANRDLADEAESLL
jgi:hypothetical protein